VIAEGTNSAILRIAPARGLQRLRNAFAKITA